MQVDILHVLVAVISVAATWFAQRQSGPAPATPAPGGPTLPVATGHPILDAVVRVLGEAQHNGALDQLRAILHPPAVPPPAAPPKTP